MTDLVNIGAQKSFTLEQVMSLLRDGEAILGPLITIGFNKDGTVMVFDEDLKEPAKKAEIAVEGESNVPQGATKVAAGTIYIKGNKKKVTVYRK